MSLFGQNKSKESFFDNHQFLWGAASAAYQVEGGFEEDGRGLSIWDVWMNKFEVAGRGVSGNKAIDFYNRKQYLKDIELFKKLGLTSYRFSVSWVRIVPDGTGKVNQKAIDHYRIFVKDLRDAGIEPIMTLYHWDMPYNLYQKGGWDNRESIKWFSDYSKIIFENFKDLVKIYVLSNEMLIETDINIQAEQLAKGNQVPMNILPAPSDLERSLRQFNHKLLAASAASKIFHQFNIPQGEVGVAFPLFPTIAVDRQSVDAAYFADGIMNRWFLDAVYKGQYPSDILKYAEEHHFKLDIDSKDAQSIKEAEFSYLGINYYSPLIIKKNSSQANYGISYPTLDNVEYAYNGANRPDQLEKLLLRIKDEYGNPPVIITENGAGFPDDDQLVSGEVADKRRTNYITNHIKAMQSAKIKGAKVFGYHVWSSHDNLEWTSGYKRRFGMIYVDFETQQRIPKESAIQYGAIIEEEKRKAID